MTHRVYLPVAPGLLRAARGSGRVGPAPLRGHAVTDAVREELGRLGVTEEEELEYAVTTAASLDAVAVLGPGDPHRRMVVALDAVRLEPAAGPDEPASAVVVPDEVPWKRVAAVLVDSPDAAEDVAAARGGDETALERCAESDLGWYAPQEVDALLPPLGGADG